MMTQEAVKVGLIDIFAWRSALENNSRENGHLRRGWQPLDADDGDVMVWLAAGLINADGVIDEDWQAALDVARVGQTGLSILAREGDQALITNVFADGAHVVSVCTRSQVNDGKLVGGLGICEVRLAARGEWWQAVSSALPAAATFQAGVLGGEPSLLTSYDPQAISEQPYLLVALLAPRSITIGWGLRGVDLIRFEQPSGQMWQVWPGDVSARLGRILAP